MRKGGGGRQLYEFAGGILGINCIWGYQSFRYSSTTCSKEGQAHQFIYVPFDATSDKKQKY